MKHLHHYHITLEWTGNRGAGTKDYGAYERNHVIRAGNKAPIEGSSDPSFRGDKAKYNPEELFVSSLSSCHMLWYLHLCAVNKIVVVAYEDAAEGTMQETEDGGGHFTGVILRPRVTITEKWMEAQAMELHHQANKRCFIAGSVNFPVRHEPVVLFLQQ